MTSIEPSILMVCHREEASYEPISSVLLRGPRECEQLIVLALRRAQGAIMISSDHLVFCIPLM
jgi:hypothetical protein